MSVKLRILRLEESRKITAGPVSYESKPEVMEWLNATIQSINDGTPGPPPSPPQDQSGYSPAQLAVIASAKAWLNEISQLPRPEGRSL